MKILIGSNKKNLIKKIKLLSSKVKYMLSKYSFIRYYNIISFINDNRQEIEYNDVILGITCLQTKNKILKIIKKHDNY